MSWFNSFNSWFHSSDSTRTKTGLLPSGFRLASLAESAFASKLVLPASVVGVALDTEIKSYAGEKHAATHAAISGGLGVIGGLMGTGIAWGLVGGPPGMFIGGGIGLGMGILGLLAGDKIGDGIEILQNKRAKANAMASEKDYRTLLAAAGNREGARTALKNYIACVHNELLPNGLITAEAADKSVRKAILDFHHDEQYALHKPPPAVRSALAAVNVSHIPHPVPVERTASVQHVPGAHIRGKDHADRTS